MKNSQSDHPLESLEQDSLKVRPYAESLAQFIANCDTPFTIAIQGDWGTGKTSMMKIIKSCNEAQKNKKIKSVWFNTWQYSQFSSQDNLPIALMISILGQIADPKGFDYKDVVTSLWNMSWKPAAKFAVKAATAGIVELEDIQNIAEKIGFDTDGLADKAEELTGKLPLNAKKSGDKGASADAEKLKLNIQKVIDNARKEQGIDRFVFFVDDLDRIAPERAIEILEVTKLFFDWEGCVFVFALDYNVVKRGLKTKFDTSTDDLGGRSFFDKIIQMSFTLPVARYDIDGFIGQLLKEMNLPMQPSDYADLSAVLKYSISLNPRSIKRTLNSLKLLMIVAQSQGLIKNNKDDRFIVRNLFALLCLQMGYESVYLWLAELGSGIEARHLTALTQNSFENEIGLKTAFSKISESRQQDYSDFIKAFVNCVQTPDQPLDEFDDEELNRLRETFTLTNITSTVVVDVQKTEMSQEERDFRWQNRASMAKLLPILTQKLQEKLNNKSISLAIYQSNGTAKCSLYISHGKKEINGFKDIGWLNTDLYIELDRIFICTSGAQKNMKLLREKEIKTPFNKETPILFDGNRVIFWQKSIEPALSLEAKEAIFLNEAYDYFLDVIQFIHSSVKG